MTDIGPEELMVSGDQRTALIIKHSDPPQDIHVYLRAPTEEQSQRLRGQHLQIVPRKHIVYAVTQVLWTDNTCSQSAVFRQWRVVTCSTVWETSTIRTRAYSLAYS